MKTITMSLVKTPIEDHPKFSKPDVRFRHMRTRKIFRKFKAAGIDTFIAPKIVIEES